MRSSHTLDRLDVAFDDDHLVTDAGLLLPATLAQHLGLRELVAEHLDLGAKPGRANVGDHLALVERKIMTPAWAGLTGRDSERRVDMSTAAIILIFIAIVVLTFFAFAASWGQL